MRNILNRVTGSRVGRRISYEYNNLFLWAPAHPARPTAIAAAICTGLVVLGAPAWLVIVPVVVAARQTTRYRRHKQQQRRFWAQILGPGRWE